MSNVLDDFIDPYKFISSDRLIKMISDRNLLSFYIENYDNNSIFRLHTGERFYMKDPLVFDAAVKKKYSIFTKNNSHSSLYFIIDNLVKYISNPDSVVYLSQDCYSCNRTSLYADTINSMPAVKEALENRFRLLCTPLLNIRNCDGRRDFTLFSSSKTDSVCIVNDQLYNFKWTEIYDYINFLPARITTENQIEHGNRNIVSSNTLIAFDKEFLFHDSVKFVYYNNTVEIRISGSVFLFVNTLQITVQESQFNHYVNNILTEDEYNFWRVLVEIRS